MRYILKRVRRFVFGVSCFCALICVVLLLNVTAPNPTGRRYSSETPPTTGEASGSVIGSAAERILANDLRLPNNNDTNQRQCFCRTTAVINANACNVCLAAPGMQSVYRIPDFISPNFIAESKNARNLLYTGREFDQISDYALAAKVLNRPLWVFIRVNTYVEPDFYQVVESTGGGVVPYFAVPGYVDPIDGVARTGLFIAGACVTGCMWLEWRSGRKTRSVAVKSPSSPEPSHPSTRPAQPERSEKRRFWQGPVGLCGDWQLEREVAPGSCQVLPEQSGCQRKDRGLHTNS